MAGHWRCMRLSVASIAATPAPALAVADDPKLCAARSRPLQGAILDFVAGRSPSVADRG